MKNDSSRLFLVFIYALMLIVFLTLFLIFSTSYLSLEHQFITGILLLLLIFAVGKNKGKTGHVGRILVMTVCVYLTLRYLIFRVTVTIYYDGPVNYAATLLLFLAELYGVFIYFFGMLVNVWPVKRLYPDFPENESDLPTVDIYIPTFNESIDIVKTTVVAATQIDYPKYKYNVYILDDGGTDQKLNDKDLIKSAKARKRSLDLKELAAKLDIIYTTRALNVSAKAGNINEALMACECFFDEDTFDKSSCINHGINQGCGDLVLILDCDHVPAKDFLKKTIGFFIEDPKLFLVQTPHFFINPNPVEKNLDIFQDGPGENEMFYGAIHPGLDFWNASFFCGSAAVLRRKFLMEAGGVSGATITEDAETSLELHSRGYNSVYLNKPMIVGLAPEIFTDFIIQRSRWAQGMIQIMILKNPLLKKGLSFFQKICYFNATLYWFFGLSRIVFFVSPLLLLYLGLRTYNASLQQVFAYVLPHLLGSYILTDYLFGKFRRPFFSELFETIQSIYLLPAIFSVMLNPKKPVFKVTPKEISRRKEFLSNLALPFYFMTTIAIVAYGFGIYKLINQPLITDPVIICLTWNTFNLILLLACLGVVWEKRQIRSVHRFNTNENIEIETEEGIFPAKLADLSVAGVGLVVDKKYFNSEPEKLSVHARDSFHNSYLFDVEVKNVIRGDKSVKIGCVFSEGDFEHYKNIVGFVYGDSSRWNFFSGQDRASSTGIFRGFFRLVTTGIRGFASNLKGVIPILWSLISARFKRFDQKYKESL